MGLLRFSRSSFDDDYRPSVSNVTNNVTIVKGNPNSYNYKILDYYHINGNLVVKINYPECRNYEGNKILVFKGVTLKKLLRQKRIDPHFSRNKKYISPFARFEPTKEGLKFAKELAVYL